MVQCVDKLPNDVASLKKLLLAEREKNAQLNKQVHALFEAIRLERHKRFGASSEKAPGQADFFDEAEHAQEEADRATASAETKTPEKNKPVALFVSRFRQTSLAFVTLLSCQNQNVPVLVVASSVKSVKTLASSWTLSPPNYKSHNTFVRNTPAKRVKTQ